MIARPQYFDRIRERAAKRWDQLEADPELAGPWHSCSSKSKAHHHILSELLQNADDAGATEASVQIENHTYRLVIDHDRDADEISNNPR